MAANRNRRLQKEIQEVQKDKLAGIIIDVLDEAQFTHLRGHFMGPPDTPYEGGSYDVDITIPAEYPFKPPHMKMGTRIWHPNISSVTGAICLDTLKTAWSPILTLKSALISLQSLLASPEPKDPQDAEVASQLLKNPGEFAEKARAWAIKYAGAPDTGSTASSASVKKQEDRRKQQDEAEQRAQLKGYPEPLVTRFTALGFSVPTVVTAFRMVGLATNGGHDYGINDETVDAVTNVLFSES